MDVEFSELTKKIISIRFAKRDRGVISQSNHGVCHFSDIAAVRNKGFVRLNKLI